MLGLKFVSIPRVERSLMHLVISLLLKIILKTPSLTLISQHFIFLLWKISPFSVTSCNIAGRMYFSLQIMMDWNKSKLRKQTIFVYVLIKIYWASIYKVNPAMHCISEKIFLLWRMWLKFKSKNFELWKCRVSLCVWSIHNVWK